MNESSKNTQYFHEIITGGRPGDNNRRGSALRGVVQGVGIDYKGAQMAATGGSTQFCYELQTEDILHKHTVHIL